MTSPFDLHDSPRFARNNAVRRSNSRRPRDRRGIIAILTAVLFLVLLGIVAFAREVGYLCLVRTQLQVAADSAALAAAGSSNLARSDVTLIAQAFAQYHQVAGRTVLLNSSDVQFGV
jgi:Flp pilus assembly protein TadG